MASATERFAALGDPRFRDRSSSTARGKGGITTPLTIEAAGATLLYLPPYSPDLNSIEMAFSKLEAHLRKAAEHTIAGLLRRIGRVVKTFTPQ